MLQPWASFPQETKLKIHEKCDGKRCTSSSILSSLCWLVPELRASWKACVKRWHSLAVSHSLHSFRCKCAVYSALKTHPHLQILTPNFSFLFGDRGTCTSTEAFCGGNKAAAGVRTVDIDAVKSLSFNKNDALVLVACWRWNIL